MNHTPIRAGLQYRNKQLQSIVIDGRVYLCKRSEQALKILGKKLQPVRITQDYKQFDEQVRTITLKRGNALPKEHASRKLSRAMLIHSESMNQQSGGFQLSYIQTKLAHKIRVWKQR